MEERKIFIVGSGPSAREFDFEAVAPNDIVLGVNGAIEWLPRIDAWFTLDPTPVNIRRMHRRREEVKEYFVAAPDDIELPEHVTRLRRLALSGKAAGHSEPSPRDTSEWWAWRFSATPGLCTQGGSIHTGNSMWGALQLACQMGHGRIVLVGLDATQDPRIGGGRPLSFAHLPDLFASALPQLQFGRVKVWNANPNSLVTCFPAFKKEAVSA